MSAVVAGDRNALNFSGGPGALPAPVLAQAREAIAALPETGVSVLGMSHRSDWFAALLAEVEANIRGLLGVDQRYALSFLQGGSSLLFATLPMNVGRSGAPPQYINAGYWSARASDEAARVGPCRVLWDGAAGGYREVPALQELAVDANAAYLHYVSNETVEGLQFADPPADLPAPLLADMSSDFLSRPLDVERFAGIYAHAQKNLGPAGVTVLLLRRDLLARIPDGLPAILDLRTHVEYGSNYNTPPVFAIYVMTLVTRWLRDQVGGLQAMARINRAKSEHLYATLAALQDVLDVHAAPAARSQMNVAFRFRDRRLDQAFLAAAAEQDMTGLEGHRSLGGLRVSLYNAIGLDAVERLCAALQGFARRHG